MATKRKAETGTAAKAVVTKKLALDAKNLKDPNKALVTPKSKTTAEAKVGEISATPITPLKDKRLSGILKAVGVNSPRSPNRVTFPPPSNIRETLSNLDDDAVSSLVHQLESLQGASLVLWLEELTSSVSLLDRRPERGQSVESLVAELLKIKWEDKEEEVAFAYIALLAHLVSACPCYTRAAVKSLFNRFRPAGERDKRSLDAIIFKRVHTGLQCLLEVSPVGARDETLNLMAEAFPYFKLSPYRQVCFVSALLEMTSYIPDSRLRVLTIIVEKIIKLDAHLSREHVGKELKEGDKKPNDPMVETLDLLMKLMLTYINTNTHHEDKYDSKKAAELIDCLLNIYTSHLLPTFNIVHTQYIIFYLANLDPEVTQRFLAVTWRAFNSPSSASITRQTAMSYLASFLSRSAIVTAQQVLAHLNRLSSWAHSYVRARESQDSGLDFMYTDLARHGPFYSACQAIFYIFAFRHQELTCTPKRLKAVQGLAWHSLVASGLNPLRVCLPGVVRNFSACARHYQLAYCQAVIERNNRINLPVVGSLSSGASVKPLLLDCFFPFDPCLLPRVKPWVERHYLQYQGLQGILQTEEEDDEESSDDEEDEDGEGVDGQGEAKVSSRRQRQSSIRSSISSSGRSRQDSVGCLNELLMQDLVS